MPEGIVIFYMARNCIALTYCVGESNKTVLSKNPSIIIKDIKDTVKDTHVDKCPLDRVSEIKDLQTFCLQNVWVR